MKFGGNQSDCDTAFIGRTSMQEHLDKVPGLSKDAIPCGCFMSLSYELWLSVHRSPAIFGKAASVTGPR